MKKSLVDSPTEALLRDQIELRTDGTIKSLRLGDSGGIAVPFQSDAHAGPAWYGVWAGQAHRIKLHHDTVDPDEVFSKHYDSLDFGLSYKMHGEVLTIEATLVNKGTNSFEPERCGIKLGVDAYMHSYPQWNECFFPTLLRCEKTHFWGYMMSPSGRILGVGSPDPIASWSLDYNTVEHDNCDYAWGGHRIYTVNLDLLNALPLPDRHPQNLTRIEPGEERRWKIELFSVGSMSAVLPTLSAHCEAPIFSIEKTSLVPGEETVITLYAGDRPQLFVRDPSGRETRFECERELDHGIYHFRLNGFRDHGYYAVFASASDRVSEALLYVRKPWSWYLKQAGKEAFHCQQKATSHVESYYGFFSLFLSEKHFPDSRMRARTDEEWERIYSLLFDLKEHRPIHFEHRIQNAASVISLCIDHYELSGEIRDVERAAGLADWLIEKAQSPDGCFLNPRSGFDYTCVIYPVKSLLELVEIESILGQDDPRWKRRSDMHFESALCAAEWLVRRGDNLETEGELTFEDGMISCAALQLGACALAISDGERRQRLVAMMERLLSQHACLVQMLVPDARQRSCTLRFWEAQYDVNMHPNMLTSPHGWTSWRTYATCYAYLLTKKVDYLRQTMNALSSSVQTIDSATGRLRWAFVVDPYVQAVQLDSPVPSADPKVYQQGHHHPLSFTHRNFVFGESYVDMISAWQHANCQDNDVHEHFKCLEELALDTAWVVCSEKMEWESWNCQIGDRTGTPVIAIDDECVGRIHFNLPHPLTLVVRLPGHGDQTIDAPAWGWCSI